MGNPYVLTGLLLLGIITIVHSTNDTRKCKPGCKMCVEPNVCLDCESGIHMPGCPRKCENCKSGRCSFADFCDACKDGFYGISCDKKCVGCRTCQQYGGMCPIPTPKPCRGLCEPGCERYCSSSDTGSDTSYTSSRDADDSSATIIGVVSIASFLFIGTCCSCLCKKNYHKRPFELPQAVPSLQKYNGPPYRHNHSPATAGIIVDSHDGDSSNTVMFQRYHGQYTDYLHDMDGPGRGDFLAAVGDIPMTAAVGNIGSDPTAGYMGSLGPLNYRDVVPAESDLPPGPVPAPHASSLRNDRDMPPPPSYFSLFPEAEQNNPPQYGT